MGELSHGAGREINLSREEIFENSLAVSDAQSKYNPTMITNTHQSLADGNLGSAFVAFVGIGHSGKIVRKGVNSGKTARKSVQVGNWDMIGELITEPTLGVGSPPA